MYKKCELAYGYLGQQDVIVFSTVKTWSVHVKA